MVPQAKRSSGKDFVGMRTIFDQAFGAYILNGARHQRVHQVQVMDHQVQHHARHRRRGRSRDRAASM